MRKEHNTYAINNMKAFKIVRLDLLIGCVRSLSGLWRHCGEVISAELARKIREQELV